MKSLRKTIQENRKKTWNFFQSHLQPKLCAIGTRYRLAARIRLANAWAMKHPGRTFACVVGSLLFVLCGDILVNSQTVKTKAIDVSIIGNIEPVIQGFHAIQSNKNVHRQTLFGLTDKGQAIKRELDSLIAKPQKSRADSIRIIRQYKRLESIVKSLKNNDRP
ncbi:hypothetical protein HPS57_13560 [Prevotella sp. PINT]|jgi:hypothetical protein|uniref:hypothetical protein n=1 Tax=Bacteroidales TaxID=171549 RepID=UPI001553D045|nr:MULTISPECIES: hypothetical protein [Bacteroidales]NPD82991.1 hypothetical protein [Palleniella intestinalis]